MSGDPGLLLGEGAAADAFRCIMAGEPRVLALCSGSGPLLSRHSLELIRQMRAAGVRVEFHSPGHSDSVLQSTNRLLADIPLDQMTDRTDQTGARLLVIDDGEKLSDPEVASLKRLVNGLSGSVLRVLVILACPRSFMRALPVSGLGGLAAVWDLEGAVPDAADAPGADGPAAPDGMPEDADEPEVLEPPDPLLDLARERAQGVAASVSTRRGSNLPWYAMLAVIAVLGGGLGVLQWVEWSRPADSTVVFDCGLHSDREAIDQLLSKLGQSTPTRVREQSGKFRLEAGPFRSKAAARSALKQIWAIGACQLEPVAAAGATVK